MAVDETPPRPQFLLHSWNVLIAATATAVALYIPLTEVSAFKGLGPESAVGGVLTALFGLDFVIQVYQSRGQGRSKKPGSRFGVALDLLSALPFFLIPGGHHLRLLRLLKLYRVGQGMRRLSRLHIVQGTALKLAYFLYWLAIGIHWITCGWIELLGTVAPESAQIVYVDALYWATSTITTVGYGDIVPVTIGQRCMGSAS